MENNQEHQSKEPGQEINADFKHNRGKHPDSKEALDKDLTDPEDYEGGDGQIVKSSDPGSQEWHAREDSQ